MNIITIDSPEDLEPKLAPLTTYWTKSGEFWSFASCRDTMRASQAFYSAAAELNGAWHGWYLATKQGEDYELLFIYCAPASRGHGVGKLLLADLIKKVRKGDKHAKVCLEVRPSNVSAIGLYESFGFVKTSIRVKYYSNGEDAFVYQLAPDNK